MAKRRPEFQLNHNNWDDEYESEETGKFQEADEGVLKNRVIRTAKRRLPRDQTDGGETAKKTTSVFSGFSFDKAASSAPANSTTSTSKPMFSFGNASSATPFSFSSSSASTAPMSSLATNSITSSASAQPRAKCDRSNQFKFKLKALNKSVLNCIKGYVESQDLCILTPIFKDYEKFVKELEDGENNKSDTTSSTISAATANSDAALTKFSFSSAKVSEASASTSSSVAAVASAATASNLTPAFSFGKPAAVAANTFSASTSGFSFASALQAAKPSTTNDTKPAENGGDKNDDAEDEEDQPPKVEFKAVVEDDSIYSKRCKVFVKDDASFKDRGTGTLYMKEVADGDKVQLIVRADTNLGNILLNIIVSKAIPASRNKNNLILVCIPTPDAKEQKPRQVLVRVKTEDDAIELLEEYQKHQN